MVEELERGLERSKKVRDVVAGKEEEALWQLTSLNQKHSGSRS